MTYLAWLIFIGAAILEVGGDAAIRKGLRGSSLIMIVLGFVMLGCYGVVVNIVTWDFSKMLGVYVALFALVSVLFGRFVFMEQVPQSTWLGLLVILCGALVIQFGAKL
jgi:small multidrug resistance family-3 protein